MKNVEEKQRKIGSQPMEASYRKVKHLEQEVDSIHEVGDEKEQIGDELAKTPSRQAKQQQTQSGMLLTAQTPRRSSRKSIKPAQDYADIVGKSYVQAKDNENENEDTGTEKGDSAPKWTPAKVGRVSQKRGRKSRKVAEKKQKIIEVMDNAGNEEQLVEENFPDDKKKQALNGNRELDQEEVIQNDVSMGANEQKVDKSKKEHFGSYLKSNELNMSDLGLNPLQDEEENEEKVVTVAYEMTERIENTVDKVVAKKVGEKDGQEVTNMFEQLPLPEESHELIGHEDATEGENEEKLHETESVTGLVVLNEVNQEDQEDKENESPANESFNASDCFIVTPVYEAEANKLSMEDDDMQPLQLSDDDEFDEIEPKAAPPRIVLTNTEDEAQTILATPPRQQTAGTPQKRSGHYRFPTPYKAKGNFAFNKDATEKEDDDVGERAADLSVTTLEPKEIIQRSIRKRSFSVCINGGHQASERKQMRNVTFHSPANQTLVIEEIDLLIAKSTKKAAEMAKDTNVTMRRKRSMSFDDSMMNRCSSKLPKPGFMHVTPIKSNQVSPKPKAGPSRTKLPNFAAIHQKHFNKMENLVEHVTRKAERAKVLTNSAGKTLTASVHKGLSTKNQMDSPQKKNEQPNALKKIDLLGIQTKPAPGVPPTAVEVGNVGSSLALPNPQMALIKPTQGSSFCTLAIKKTARNATPAKDFSKRAPMLSTKPRFNLSTSMLPKATSVRQAPTVIMPASVAAPTASTSAPSDKMATRRQRHMDMFKGRAGAGAHIDASKNGAIIRGVRSNRRFDLQMQHRRNLDHN